MSDFAGRDEEISELYRWATSNHPVSIKFLTGDGGVGKSRLAAHFANELRKKDWAAGFVNLRKAVKFPLNKDGSLLIVDYPEQNPSGVQELLCDLATLEQSEKIKLRVLFLSREPVQRWLQIFGDSNSLNLIDMKPMVIGGMHKRPAYEVFCSAQEKTAEIFNTTPLPVSEFDLLEWVNQAEENQRALFIVAAAVHSAIHPEENVFGYTGPEVINALVDREIERLRGIADIYRVEDKNFFARLQTMAAMAGELTSERISELAAMQELHLGLPKGDNLTELLNNTMILSDGVVHPPEPDIVAAAFTVKVLSQMPKTAPELIWSCLSENIEAGLERITRITYDAEILLGIHQNRISRYFAAALEKRPDRCKILDEYFSKIVPITSFDASIVVWQTLLSVTGDDHERSRLLNNLSADLAQFGNKEDALEAIREAVEIRRRLAKANPVAFEPDLATSLNNMSSHLSDVGNKKGALEAIRKAVEIRRRLAKANPAAFEPDLASSLNNLSNSLSDVGDKKDALEVIREAVEIYRHLAKANPATFEWGLARSINNLSNRLSALGDKEGALEAILEAVEIRRRLAKANPAAFEPNLANSLNNLSNHLSDVGDKKDALEAIREAVEIYRRLAKTNPAAFEPNLASSINNLSNRLSALGDKEGALEAIRKAVEIYRHLAKANPAAFETDLAKSIGTLGTMLRQTGRIALAVDAFREGTNLIRPFAERYPQSPFAELLEAIEQDLKETEEQAT